MHRKGGIADLALFLGVGETFQIWNPQALLEDERIPEDLKDVCPVGVNPVFGVPDPEPEPDPDPENFLLSPAWGDAFCAPAGGTRANLNPPFLGWVPRGVLKVPETCLCPCAGVVACLDAICNTKVTTVVC